MKLCTTFHVENLPDSPSPAKNKVGSFAKVDSLAEALAVIQETLGGAPKALHETSDGNPITFDTHTKGKQSGFAYVNRKPDGWLITYGDARDGERHNLFVQDTSPGYALLPAPVQQDTGKAERAAQIAAKVWESARPAGADHPYLVRKQVRPTDTLRELPADELVRLIGYPLRAGDDLLEGRILIAPVAVGDAISTVEFIDERGRKTALAGGRKSGGYWATGPLPETGRVVIAEGVATALSIAEALGETVVAALSVGNLEKVGRALKSPGRELVIAADLGEGGNPHEEAVKAARALGARLCAPASDLGKGGDFNDLHVRDGLDAVRAVFAHPGAPGEVQDKAALLSLAMPTFAELQSDFRETHWLWPCWLPRGEFVVIAGAPGAGKTTAVISIAAHVSTGSFRLGELGKPHNVLVFTREDSYLAAILPRLMAAGADLNKVRALEGLPSGKGGLTPFDPASDAGRLRDYILKLPDDERPALIIFDGIADAVKRDSHNNTDVRHALLPYVELARETDACVIGITHFSKNSKGRLPAERVMGSVAFTAMARTVIAVQHNQGKEGLPERVFVQVKNNLAGWQPAEGFQIEPATITVNEKSVQTSVATWTGTIQGSAYQVLEQCDDLDDDPDGEDSEKSIALREACEFLQEALRNGARPAKDVIRESHEVGISKTTLYRARHELSVKSFRSGPDGGYVWALPPTTESDGEGSNLDSKDSNLDSNLDSKDSIPLESSPSLESSLESSLKTLQLTGQTEQQADSSLDSNSSLKSSVESSLKTLQPAGQSERQADSSNLPPWLAGGTTTGASAAPVKKSKFERFVEECRCTIEAAWWLTGEKKRDGQPFIARGGLIKYLLDHRRYNLNKAQAEVNPSNRGKLAHTLLKANVIAIDPDSDGFRVIDPELAASLIQRSKGDRLGARETETATEPSPPGVSEPGGTPLCEPCGEPMTLEADGTWTCPSCGYWR